MSDAFETVLFVAREAFVYKVPPRASAAGYKAAEWGDMEAFLWKGRLRIIEKGEECAIRLEDGTTGELFANCPYDIKGQSVEPVLDSSRYFVLRVVSALPDGSERKAFIGMGFQDRSDSFDFNVALQDWTKRQKAALSGSTSGAAPGEDVGPSPHLPASGAKDYSLKEGQTFAIKIPGAGGRKIAKGGGVSLLSGGAGGGGPLLPPPPPPASRRN